MLAVPMAVSFMGLANLKIIYSSALIQLFIMPLSVKVHTGGVKIAPNRYIPSGAIIDTQPKANAVGPVPTSQEEFAEEVQHVNQEFPAANSLMFGSIKFSCGLTCDPESLKL
jgi:carbon dioxide concentrating mechanism protein CcmM